MTGLLDLQIAVSMILEITSTMRSNLWIYGYDFKQLTDAIKVFRAYYWERKALYAIPQSLFDEIDGYIAKFPTPYYHYTIKAADQNNMVDALIVLGKFSEYHPILVNAGHVKRIYVHWLNPDGSIKQTFDYFANQKPKVPHWIDGTDYADGNVKIEMVWSAQADRSIRFDTRTYLLWSKFYLSWIQGSCISTPLVQDYSLYQYLRMPSEHIQQECKIMDCALGVEYASLVVPIEVTDVSPPLPLTATLQGTMTACSPFYKDGKMQTVPFQGVKVSVGGHLRYNPLLPHATTDAQGKYKITGIPVGYQMLSADAEGLARPYPQVQKWLPNIAMASREFRMGAIVTWDFLW